MRKFLVLAGVACCIVLTSSGAFADSIEKRLGVTGTLGFLFPSDSDFNDFRINTDAGFVGGGGLIYGFDRNIAIDFNVTHTWYGGNLPSGPDRGEFEITDIAMGAQYRFMLSDPKFVPYAGGGIDILVNDYKREDGSHPDVDTVVGIHLKGGIDYFLTRQIALNAEVKAVIAPEADINQAGSRGGNFDPSSFAGLFSVRYFLW